MPPDRAFPTLPPLTEKFALLMREGTSEALEAMAEAAGVKGLATYIRLLVEREIQIERPDDFKRLRGVN